jgi:hypothetical protein
LWCQFHNCQVVAAGRVSVTRLFIRGARHIAVRCRFRSIYIENHGSNPSFADVRALLTVAFHCRLCRFTLALRVAGRLRSSRLLRLRPGCQLEVPSVARLADRQVGRGWLILWICPGPPRPSVRFAAVIVSWPSGRRRSRRLRRRARCAWLAPD